MPQVDVDERLDGHLVDRRIGFQSQAKTSCPAVGGIVVYARILIVCVVEIDALPYDLGLRLKLPASPRAKGYPLSSDSRIESPERSAPAP